jgi:hypothetical protein
MLIKEPFVEACNAVTASFRRRSLGSSGSNWGANDKRAIIRSSWKLSSRASQIAGTAKHLNILQNCESLVALSRRLPMTCPGWGASTRPHLHMTIRAPRGHSAPDRTWRQCHDDTVPEADAILKCSRLIGHSRAPRTPPLLIKGCVSNCCGEGMHKNVKIYTQHETPRNIKAV